MIALVPMAMAGPWTRPAGEVWAKLAGDSYVATRYVDPRTGEESVLDYTGHQVGLQAEVGLGHRLQVAAGVPLSVGVVSFVDERLLGGGVGHATTIRLGDAHAALQLGLLDGVAVAADAKVPLYANDSVGDGAGDYAIVFPYPGDGQVDLTAWILAGRSLGHGLWIEGAAGYRHRTEWFLGWDTDHVYADGVPFRAALGLGGRRGWIAVSGDGVKNVVADAVTRESLSAGLAGGIEIGRGFSVEARVAAELWANNAAQGIGGGVGLAWRRASP